MPEMLVVLGLFAVASALIFQMLSDGFRKFRAVNSRYDTQQRLNKSLAALQRDLEKADSNQIGLKRISTSGGNGDAIWFLSADDPTQSNPDLRFIRDPASGMPNWQRHILYYLIRPTNYAKVSGGYTVPVDPDLRNDYYAPHKLLIRKVINRPSNPEKLMTAAEVDAFTTAPPDLNVSSLASEAQVESCRLISNGLLSFEATRYDHTLEMDLRAVHIDRANAILRVGSVSLKTTPYTETQRLRVVMKK